ncbi:hypothetical protein PPMP20_22825 [Paraburkholderia phymatum]|uniref:hypothetical protein n=1 Tax=Paraburkholderia phymatum TaxID=148447 RepID=UPI0012FE1D68|nr:hypothetical protein [Paraburkholderia phymatum]
MKNPLLKKVLRTMQRTLRGAFVGRLAREGSKRRAAALRTKAATERDEPLHDLRIREAKEVGGQRLECAPEHSAERT